MSSISIEDHGLVTLIRMDRGATNALNPELVESLADGVAEIRSEGRALVLAGGEKFFSIGLDLPELLRCDLAELTRFWEVFNGCCLDLYTFPRPTASAITGHAIAGGTILALMTDSRVIATGRKLMGLNEIALGLPVPLLPQLALRELLGDRGATSVVYGGQLHDSEATLKMGIVDERVLLEEVETRAVAVTSELAALPALAFAAIKRTRTDAVADAYRRRVQRKTEEFLHIWFLDETQTLLTKAAEKF